MSLLRASGPLFSSLAFAALVAFAGPRVARAESECDPLDIVALQPSADGAVVPAGATVRVFYDDGLCREVDVAVTCDGVASPTATSTVSIDLTIVELELGADVAAGASCEMVLTDADTSNEVDRRTFTVGDEQPAALAAPALTGGRLEQLTGDGSGLSRFGNALIEAAPDPLGMSKIAVYSDAFGLCGVAPAPSEGGRVDLQLDCAAPADGDACVRVEQIDALGRVSTAEGCLETFTAEEDEESGCSVGRAGVERSVAPFAVGLAGLAALATRRRRSSAPR